MIKGIVYLSNTGHTERYARMAAEAAGIPASALNLPDGSICRNDPVLYMGWVQNNRIRGYLRAALIYDVIGVCGVGLRPGEEDILSLIREKNGITNPRIKVFYLRGGLDKKRLSPVQRLLLNGVSLELKRESKDPSHTMEKDKIGESINLLGGAADFVSPEALQPVIDFIRRHNGIIK